MFARLSAIVVSALALASLVAAVPTTESYGGVCKTGYNKCCETADTYKNLERDHKLGDLTEAQLLDLEAFKAKNQKIGLKCFNLVGGTCSHQNVCCEDNKFNGLVFLGCNNINVA